MPTCRLVFAACALLPVACASEDPPEKAPPAARMVAENAAGRLMKTLLERLTNALAEGPPEHAFAICADVAQEISEDVRRETHVDVRRTSLKVRNPKNRPDAWEEAWLREAEGRERIPPGGEAFVVRGDDGSREVRFVRPLFVAPLCTACHGPREELSPEVRGLLDEKYPDDRATGYAPGDFRGIVSVRVPLTD